MVRITPTTAKLFLPLQESVIDYSRSTLDPQLFDSENMLRPEVKKFILGEAALFAPFGQVQVYIKGSILSYQWTPTTDVDVLIVLDPDSEDDFQSAVDLTFELPEMKVPGTRHPLDFYVLREDVLDLTKYDGVYSLYPDEGWLAGPYNLSADISKYLETFRVIVDKIDLDRAELYRDIIDYKILKSLGDDIKDAEKLVKAKLAEITDEAQDLVRTYEVVHGMRGVGFAEYLSPEDASTYKSKNLLPTNIIFKLLQRYHYIELLRAIRQVMREGGSGDSVVDRLGKILQVDEMTTTANVAGYSLPLGMRKKKKRRRKDDDTDAAVSGG